MGEDCKWVVLIKEELPGDKQANFSVPASLQSALQQTLGRLIQTGSAQWNTIRNKLNTFHLLQYLLRSPIMVMVSVRDTEKT